MKKRLLIFIFFSAVLCCLNGITSSEEAAKAASATTKQQKKSLTMEETKVQGVVEKPEFINLIQRRRLEFQDKGELNISFKDKILQTFSKEKLEDTFYEDISKILNTGSISSD